MHLLSRLEYERLCGTSWSIYFVRIPKLWAYQVISPVLEIHLNAD
jgi:hypothetical protein